jgi:hypothetical protein
MMRLLLAITFLAGCGGGDSNPPPVYISPFVGQTDVALDTPLFVRHGASQIPPGYPTNEPVRVVDLDQGGFVPGEITVDGDDLSFAPDGGWAAGRRYAWTVDPMYGVPHGPLLGVNDNVDGTGAFTAGYDPTVLGAGLFQDTVCLLLSEPWDEQEFTVTANDVPIDDVSVELIDRPVADDDTDWHSHFPGDVACLDSAFPVAPGAALRVWWGDRGPWRVIVSAQHPDDLFAVLHRATSRDSE